MFTIVEIDSYSDKTLVFRDELVIIGSFKDSQKELKLLYEQILKDKKETIEETDYNDDRFTIFFETDKYGIGHIYSAQIIKVSM